MARFFIARKKGWTLDAGRWTLDAGRWTLDAGQRCARPRHRQAFSFSLQRLYRLQPRSLG
ncbi:hypothetical protein DNK44_20845 [Pseudomonas dryadis]|uniref:Phosphotransferase n=1 Tax=Phytopseudomonas dryadis TaxID=2487520 RepID=A0A4Q9QV25_9GAMM|nr:hypothetical protein DNK44_20845 [Pseudomonas dryadis]